MAQQCRKRINEASSGSGCTFWPRFFPFLSCLLIHRGLSFCGEEAALQGWVVCRGHEKWRCVEKCGPTDWVGHACV
jgi:hypothetical protein